MIAPVSPPPTAQQRTAARLALCKACPQLAGRKPLERCQACGCLVRARVLVGSWACPEGKW